MVFLKPLTEIQQESGHLPKGIDGQNIQHNNEVGTSLGM
jgi:hypothetical protein